MHNNLHEVDEKASVVHITYYPVTYNPANAAILNKPFIHIISIINVGVSVWNVDYIKLVLGVWQMPTYLLTY